MMHTEAKFNLLNKSAADDDGHDSIANYNHQSAELIGSNVDLLTKILLGLPAKSIIRFKSVSKEWLDYDSSRNYNVFNQTTKKFALIPPVIGSKRATDLIRFMGLAYYPTECVHYKLVCILRAGISSLDEGYDEHWNRMYNIQIYYSRTGKWKKLKKQTFTPLDYTEFRYGVYWNGAFHWASSCPNPMYLRLDSEQLQDLPLPVRYGGYLPLYFGESRGHLHLVDNMHGNKPSSMNVYEMLRDHSGWFIKYQLDFHQLFAVNYPRMTRQGYEDEYEFKVLDVVRG
ncbi:F-box protein At5g07610-like [Rutidosis leptorrhynchoides]|uniref:F-box protein At5g07610-like n=1 Tax=Rutidosis leptorrhynchoides TaxID=125765 RepID=UPI003A9A6007